MPEALPSVIRVLIVDDHRLFNDGLKAMLASEPTIQVVGQVYQSKDTPYYVGLHAPDLLLMDFNMPGIDGLEMTRQLLKTSPDLKILILSMYNERRYVDDFRRAGAKGYLLKTSDIAELVRTIGVIREGGIYFGEGDRKINGQNPHGNDDFIRKFQLTPRELEVIQHIKLGLPTQQIAEAMHVSFFTVETHRRNIHFKLKVKGIAELMRFISENGL